MEHEASAAKLDYQRRRRRRRHMFCSCSVNTCSSFAPVSLMVLCYFNYQAGKPVGRRLLHSLFCCRNDYKWLPIAFWGLSLRVLGLRLPSLAEKRSNISSLVSRLKVGQLNITFQADGGRVTVGEFGPVTLTNHHWGGYMASQEVTPRYDAHSEGPMMRCSHGRPSTFGGETLVR